MGRATACLDVSDGLAGDAAHLAKASKQRVVVEAQALARALRPELEEAAKLLGTTALELAITGGEDYSLLATGPREKRPRWVRRIGRVESGKGALLESEGRTRPLHRGFDHLR